MNWKNITPFAIIATLLAVANLVVLVVFVCLLPDVVPIHFNVDMVVDRVGSAAWLVVFGIIPVLIALGLILELVLRKREYANRRVLQIFMSALAVFFAWFGWVFYDIVSCGAEMGEKVSVSMSLLLMLPLGLLLVVFGNYLPKIRPNRTLGIKLPWTLKSEECWNKTHRFSGYVAIVAGAILSIGAIICGVLNIDAYVFIFFGVAMLLFIIAPIIYAVVTYKKIEANQTSATKGGK